MRDEFDLKEKLEYYSHHITKSIFTFLKWLTFSLLSGIIIGGAGTLFHYCMTWANDSRTANPSLILLLPIAGLVIVGAYHLLHDEKDTGTNLILCRTGGRRLTARRKYWKYIGTTV